MPTVEIRGWPAWSDDDDLKAVIEGAGHIPESLRFNRDTNTAIAEFSSIAAAGAVAAQLNGFEFTPGYPLQANAVADPLPAGPANRPSAKPQAAPAKGSGKGSADRALMDEGVVTVASEFPVANCVGAGRIDGWFANPKSQVDPRGWGHVQSFSFEGNVVFRPVYSPLLRGHEYNNKDPVAFEVVVAADGRHEAVNLALASQEAEAPEPGEGEAPWEDAARHELESFIGANQKWLLAEGEELLRSFSAVDQQRVLSSGTLQGVRDPCKVLHVRVRKAKEAEGELEPFEVRTGRRQRMWGPWGEEDWAAWGWGWAPGSDPNKPQRDETWGNQDGTGVFFGSLDPEIDENTLGNFAAAAGNVTFVKIFKDRDTDESRGCGKVFYETPEMAQRAIQELHKQKFYSRFITCEGLGEENRRKRKRSDEQGPQTPAVDIYEGPRLLPFSGFQASDSLQSKVDLCYAAFEDLLVSHDPVSTGKGIVWMVRSLIREINDIFEGDDAAKQAVLQRLKSHNWFWENEQQIKWQASKNRINISKVSPSTPAWREKQEQLKKDQQQGSPGPQVGFVQAAKQWDASMNGVWSAVHPDAAASPSAAPPRPVPTRAPQPTQLQAHQPQPSQHQQQQWPGPPRTGRWAWGEGWG